MARRRRTHASQGASWGARRGVAHLQLTQDADGAVVDTVACLQLELEIDVDPVAPQLVVTVVDASDPGNTHTQPPARLNQAATARIGRVMQQVVEFHSAFNLPAQPTPDAHVGDVLAELRVRLLREETEEFADGTIGRDIIALADALADVVYVAYGSALTYGIDLDAVISEVHRSNMSKLDAEGRPVLREDGKVLKSSRYTPPDVASVLDEQLPLFTQGSTRSTAFGS